MNSFAQRILAENSALAGNRLEAEDRTWVKKVEQKQNQKYGKNKNILPEGTFEKDAGAIAQVLKRESKDYKQAMSRLNFYINRGGDNLSSSDKQRLERAKDQLKRLYVKED